MPPFWFYKACLHFSMRDRRYWLFLGGKIGVGALTFVSLKKSLPQVLLALDKVHSWWSICTLRKFLDFDPWIEIATFACAIVGGISRAEWLAQPCMQVTQTLSNSIVRNLGKYTHPRRIFCLEDTGSGCCARFVPLSLWKLGTKSLHESCLEADRVSVSDSVVKLGGTHFWWRWLWWLYSI